MRFAAVPLLVLALGSMAPAPASAWGAQGHRIVSGDAMRALPENVPPFLRTPEAIAEVTALGPEPDRLRAAGGAFDADASPGHFADGDDNATIDGVPLAQLPPNRQAYDTALRGGAPIDGRPANEYVAGYLPYSIIEGWQVIVEDLGIWRVDAYGEAHASDPATGALFAADRRLREVLTLRDVGYWSHFVADGSQPLHVSVHYNGWGAYPNPNNYTQSKTTHADFETKFVNAYATAELVQPRIGPFVPATQPIAALVGAYLAKSNALVPTVYQLFGAGAFAAGTPQAVDFTLDRLAAGAQMTRDLIVDAYAASADTLVGYPGVRVRDVESGAVAPRPDAKP